MTYAALNIEELHAEIERIGAERGAAERGFKAQQHAIQQEINRRAAKGKLADVLGALDPDERATVLAELVKE